MKVCMQAKDDSGQWIGDIYTWDVDIETWRRLVAMGQGRGPGWGIGQAVKMMFAFEQELPEVMKKIGPLIDGAKGIYDNVMRNVLSRIAPKSMNGSGT